MLTECRELIACFKVSWILYPWSGYSFSLIEFAGRAVARLERKASSGRINFHTEADKISGFGLSVH